MVSGTDTATPEGSSDYQHSETETLEIDGKKAILTIYGYEARIYILAGKSDYGSCVWEMTISSKKKFNLETAKQIFKVFVL